MEGGPFLFKLKGVLRAGATEETACRPGCLVRCKPATFWKAALLELGISCWTAFSSQQTWIQLTWTFTTQKQLPTYMEDGMKRKRLKATGEAKTFSYGWDPIFCILVLRLLVSRKELCLSRSHNPGGGSVGMLHYWGSTGDMHRLHTCCSYLLEASAEGDMLDNRQKDTKKNRKATPMIKF